MSVNQVTQELAPYPMEELARIRHDLVQRGKDVFDFGTGDPLIPTWEPIRQAAMQAFPRISQYPTVKGTPDLMRAIWGYMGRRFGVKESPAMAVLPTAGSKEAVFHVALSLIGRAGGRRTLVYPDPGYPVYRSSALFAGGTPYPVRITEKTHYLLEAWNLPKAVQDDTAAIWVNYPHNPTGAEAPRSYFEKLLDWAEQKNVVVLSDDCYIDIYDAAIDEEMVRDPKLDRRPINPIVLGTKNLISFMSLSKRSGLTGYRSGFMIGDKDLIVPMTRARANFGVSTTNMIAASAVVAWNDDAHVQERRRIFTDRIRMAFPTMQELGMLDEAPRSTFYLWCRVPEAWRGDDVGFCMKLAEQGVITSPSSWLSEGMGGYVRFALVPEEKELAIALDILRRFVKHGPK